MDITRKWFTNPDISARAAAKIVKQRLEQNGPQSESCMYPHKETPIRLTALYYKAMHTPTRHVCAGVSHLMELARRIKTPEEAALAIEVAQKFALHRARRQQHDGISPSLSAFLLKVNTAIWQLRRPC